MADPLQPDDAVDVAGVVARMEAIQRQLPDGDGLKWFNYLYLEVTKEVQVRLRNNPVFQDPAWIDRLDVVFANLYFRALRAAAPGGLGGQVPRAWRPLLSNRAATGVARVQFALAGMNAHINRDLVVALLSMFEAAGAVEPDGGVRHADFTRVNHLLEQVESRVKAELLADVRLPVGHPALARLQDVVAMWSVRQARQAAWDGGQGQWHLRHFPPAQRASLAALDRVTELAGNGLVVRVLA